MHSAAKYQKMILFGVFTKISRKKNKKMRILNSLLLPKNLKEWTLWDFLNIRSVAKIEGRTLWGIFSEKKFPNAEKKLKRGNFWSSPVLYITRETFLVQFPGPTGAI